MILKKYLTIVVAVSFTVSAASCHAIPACFKSYEREQIEHIDTVSNDLIRIWILYIGQGDSILIQIPSKIDGINENIDILVDTGSYHETNLAADSLKSIYTYPTTIEHLVISHHDSDHVKGLNNILSDGHFSIPNVWHNGLTTLNASAFNLTSSKILSAPSIKKEHNKFVTHFMGFYDKNNGNAIDTSFVLDDLDELQYWHSKQYLGQVYLPMAQVLLENEKNSIYRFDRVFLGSPFINVPENNLVKITPIWPEKILRSYGDWGESINGNSLSFKFEYGEFSMLFTGDLNDKSQKVLLKHYKERNSLDELKVDVLKIPHHGSGHYLPEFTEVANAVISVASMGKQGFETNWKHPSEKIINSSGGSHRFYSTYIHERQFKYETLGNDVHKMREKTHVLIETDGSWFRIVEIEPKRDNLAIPPVKYVRPGDGTRWISATDNKRPSC